MFQASKQCSKQNNSTVTITQSTIAATVTYIMDSTIATLWSTKKTQKRCQLTYNNHSVKFAPIKITL